MKMWATTVRKAGLCDFLGNKGDLVDIISFFGVKIRKIREQSKEKSIILMVIQARRLCCRILCVFVPLWFNFKRFQRRVAENAENRREEYRTLMEIEGRLSFINLFADKAEGKSLFIHR